MSFPFTVPLTPKEVITPTSVQRAPLGTRGMTADGRVYRYARGGATALVKGYLCQSENTGLDWNNATCSYLSTDWLVDSYVNATAIPVSTTFLNLSATMGANMNASRNLFKEGWLFISGTSTSAGQTIKIASHTAASSGSTGIGATGGKCVVQFEAGYALSEPIDTAAEISLVKNEYDDLVVAPIATEAQIVGAPNVDVSATYYFWLQTWGPCALKSEAEAITAGKPVYNSTQTAGGIQGVTGSTDFVGGDSGGYANSGRMIGHVISSSGTAVLQASCNILVHLTLAP